MTERSVKAAIYARQSLDRTKEELAVDRQLADCQRLAHQRGWEVVRTEIDNDISAKGKRYRPGFEAVLTAVESGEVGAVIGVDMTRVTRNRRDEVRLIEAGQRAKIILAFVRASDLNLAHANDRMVAEILASVARQEIEQKSERQKRANEQAAEKGKRVGGRRPFGYESDGKTIRGTEAAAIRRAYDDALAGVSLARVAKDWNAAGLRTPQTTRGGKKTRAGEPSKWSSSTARDVLANPRYAGLRGYAPVPEHGRRKITETYPAEWPGIVSEETWRAMVGLLANPDRYNAKYRRARSLLTGVALCGVCGHTVHSGGANSHQKHIYRCAGSYGHVSRSAAPVDQWVSDVAIARLSRKDAAELLRDDDRPDIETLRREATALRARLDQLATEFADGVLTSSQLRTATSKLRSKLDGLETQMASTGRVDVLGDLVLAEDVRAVWEALSTDRRRAVIDALMIIRLMPPGRGTRTFRPETVIITPRI